ncbi:MAG: ATP-binding protein [Pyrinomonadaceae bacterium]
MLPESVREVDETIEQADLEYLSSEVPRSLDEALSGIARISTIVQSIKDFAHPGGAAKTVADLNRAIESTITVASNEWKYVAEMATDLDPVLSPVPCHVGEVNQVVLNMIINAAHSIEDVVGTSGISKGKITVSTKQIEGWAEIRITDTGKGIKPSVKDKVFDPFFTTKEVGKGTGQGLAIAHNIIVGKHNGTIDIDTELGHGTTFIVRLPISETSG